MQQKRLSLSWVLCGALLCVLLIDLILFNNNQHKCSLCVQLERRSVAADFQFGVDHHGPSQEVANGLKRVQTHYNTLTKKSMQSLIANS